MSHLKCTGWWEQAGFGRQYMDGLLIVIEEGRITGSGVDLVGPFTFAGVVEEGNKVYMVKEYLGKHLVDYFGHYDGDARLWGHWRLHLLRGAWEIRIKASGAEEEAEDTEAVAEEVVPAEAVPEASAQKT